MGLLRWLRSLLHPVPWTPPIPVPPATPSASKPNAPVAAKTAPVPATPSKSFADWTGYGYLGAVGESQYQDALMQVSRSGCICEATLVPEPENPFDVNAVVVKIDGLVVGYLPRSHARKYQRRLLTLTEPHRCPAKLIGGTPDKPNFGVLLDTRVLEHMPSPKRTRKKQPKMDPADTPF